MSINATLFGQAITFAILIWFTMRFVWPVLMQALAERERTISDGLAAAERGHFELAKARETVAQELATNKRKIKELLNAATERADKIIEQAKAQGQEEYQHLLTAAQDEIAKLKLQVNDQARKQLANVAILCAEKALEYELKDDSKNYLLERAIGQLSEQ